jgi:hypothetical protein
MNIVWVLTAIVTGYFTNSVVPTMEFGTQQKCEAAIAAFEQDAKGKSGTARLRCVKIEK